MREYDRYTDLPRRRRRRFDDDEPPPPPTAATAEPADSPISPSSTSRAGSDIDGPPTGDRWSTWDGAHTARDPARAGSSPSTPRSTPSSACSRPARRPTSTSSTARCPDTDRRACSPPSATARAEHRMFHRDAGYLEGRRVRRSRETRAMASAPRSAATCSPGSGPRRSSRRSSRLWADGVAVPYPVQLDGTELLLEFVGDPDGAAAPRLAQLRPDPDELADLWQPAGRRPARAGPPRPGPRRPVRLQPAGRTTEPAGGDRPAAGRRRGRQPAGSGVPRPRRGAGRRSGSPRAGCRATSATRCSLPRPLSCAFPRRHSIRTTSQH